MLRSLASWGMRLLGENDSSVSMTRPTGHGPDEKPNPDDLKKALRGIVSGRSTITAGCFHLIGLSSLRERLGSRWKPVADRVYLLTEKLLKQHLDSRDVWLKHDAEVYVIVFARLGKIEAQLLCGKILQELHSLLMGDVDTASISVETAVITDGGDLKFESTALSDLILHAIDSATARGFPREGGPPAAEDKQLFHLSALPSWATDNQVREMAPPDILYRPIWDRRNEVISRYACAPARAGFGSAQAFWHDVLPDPQDVWQIFELDVHVLCTAVQEMYLNFKKETIVPVVIPVHFESLAVESRRRQYIALCRKFPRRLVPFAALELLGLPIGVPISRLVEVVSRIQPYCRSVFASVGPDTSDARTLATAGIKVVRVGLRPGLANNNIEVMRFLAVAQKCNLVTCLDGVRSLSDFDAAQSAGASLLTGPFIGGWTDAPGITARRSRKDFNKQFSTSVGYMARAR